MSTFTNQVIRCISNYRKLEKASLKEGYEFIKSFSSPDVYNHLCGHWKAKEKSFGSFFLNLSWKNQIRILHIWEITDPEDEQYLAIDERLEPEKYLFGEPPKTVKAIRNFILFSCNHAIEESPAEGVQLSNLPKEGKRYGNTANWGDYILTLQNPSTVIDEMINHYDNCTR